MELVESVSGRDATLAAVIATVCKMREEAVRARRASGIEEIWRQDTEMYEGIDDANRAEEGVSRGVKPYSDGGAVARVQRDRSTVFLNIAKPYCDAAAARIGDMLLPVDDRTWGMKPTPMPELPEEEAKERVRLAEKRIEDWLVEADWHGEVRKVIDNAARIGTGVLKGPFPILRRFTKTRVADPFVVLERGERIDPTSKSISPWDLFPDPACGENIHNGSFVFERERFWTKKMLAEYRSPAAQLSGWLPDQIELVLQEEPKYYESTDGSRDDYEVWHCYCTLEREDLAALGVQGLEDAPAVYVPVYAVLCNDKLIKLTMSPLDGEFPYDVFPWSSRDGMPWGRGVVRQVRTPQRIVNAAVRNMMDNAGASAGVLMFLNRSGIDTNGGQGWTIGSNRVFLVEDGVDLGRAVRTVELPSRQAELLNIVQFAMKVAEDVTGLPMLLQGQQGGAPDTVGGMQMLNNNATGVLRRLARQFDSYVVEPHIRRYNAWLQNYAEDERMVGEWIVDARGSSALVDRDLQNQAVAQMLPFLNDPAFRIDKAKWFAEWSKSQRLDPKLFQYDDEEWERISQQPAPPPPEIATAQIRAETALRQTQIKEAAATDRKATELAVEKELELAKLAAARERELMKLIAEENLSKAEIKARLLDIVTKDRRDRDLFLGQRMLKQRFGAGVDLPG